MDTGLAGHFPGVVVGMQQMMGDRGEGLFKVVFISGENGGIFMGEAKGIFLIQRVKACGPLRPRHHS